MDRKQLHQRFLGLMLDHVQVRRSQSRLGWNRDLGHRFLLRRLRLLRSLPPLRRRHRRLGFPLVWGEGHTI